MDRSGNNSAVRSQAGVIFTLLSIAALTIMGAAIAPSLPDIRDHFSETRGAEFLTRLLLTVPALAIALCAPGVGWLLDRYGRRRIVLFCVVLFALSGTAGLYLDSLVAIIVSRAVLGACVAGTLTGATTLVGDYFDDSDRNRVLGMQSAFVAFAGVVFLLAGGALAELHWRAPFAVHAIAILILPFAIVTIREPQRPSAASDSRARGASAPARVIVLVVSLYVVSFFLQIAFYMIPVQLPFFLREMGISSPGQTGMALATMTACAAVVASQYRKIEARIDRTVILTICLSTVCAGFFLVSAATSYRQVVVAMIVMGLAMGLNFPNIMTWLMARTPAHVRGRVVGGLTMCIFFGQFFSPIASHPFVERGGLSYAYQVLAILLAALSVAALAGAIIKPYQERRATGA
jgi:MFS family permease